MQETQREPVPRTDAGELATAIAFLSFQRHCVLKKAEGLTEEQLRRSLVPSGTSILGLIRHLAGAERFWFTHTVGGGDEPADDALSMTVPPGLAVAEVIEDYRAAIAASDLVVELGGSPEALTVIPIDGRRKTLRWVIAHMATETARHAGHADIIREQLDGATGR
ncbi:DinB family protein [Lentzea sp. NPDC058450]|uniref:DinB family protein n=1 Tax=Lentzea sp. NPDC058450 TaxID=3346505 RepID=UPI0036544A8A